MKLEFDKVGERFFETGVKNCALYVRGTDGAYPKGVAWNGVTAISESPSGAESNKIYADDGVYMNLIGNEEFGATIEAYTSPKEFDECDGSAELATGVSIGQQSRKTFGLAYQTTVGNDTEGTDLGVKTHLIYGATAAPSSRDYATINESPEAMTLSWELTTTPVAVKGHKPVSTVVIDSRTADPAKYAALLDILYGKGDADTGTEARLPLPDEIAELMAAA